MKHRFPPNLSFFISLFVVIIAFFYNFAEK